MADGQQVRLILKPDEEALRSLPLLQAFPGYLLAALKRGAKLVRFGPDEQIFQAGEPLSELHYLLSGAIGATRPRVQGKKEDVVDILLPVQPLCLPAALLGLPAPIGVRSRTAGHLISLSASQLRKMMSRDPALAQPFFDYALREAHEQASQNYDLRLRSTPQRLADFLFGLIEDPAEKPARFVLPFEKGLIAMRVGCTQANLSRAFAKLRRIGVQTRRGVVIVHDVSALKTVAYASGQPTRRRGRRKRRVAGETPHENRTNELSGG
jgi:CRP-like cAMP-binding protein